MASEGEGEKERRYAKGDRAAVVRGRKNLGVRGQIFWIGENKFGSGTRYGLRGDDGESYWVDGAHLGDEASAPPAPDAPPPRPELARGTRVAITAGRDGVGEQGEIFWVGENKFGPGKRYGVKTSEEATYWVDETHLEVLAAPPEGAPAPRAPSRARAAAGAAAAAAPAFDDAPLPDPDDFSDPPGFRDDGAFQDGTSPDGTSQDGGSAGFDDDVPFPGDDVPF